MAKQTDAELKGILELVFPGKVMRGYALAILLEIRNRQHAGNLFIADEWESFIEKHNIPENSYYAVMKRLRKEKGLGLIVKKGGHLKGWYAISGEFIENLLREWNKFLSPIPK